MNATKLLFVGGIALALFAFLKRDTLVQTVRNLIAGEEGLRLTVYQDTGGVWTVGYGHVVRATDGLYPYTNKKTITEAEANAFFAADTATATNAVAQYVRVPLTESQRSALISLAFNIGATAFRDSTLVRKLNAGDIVGAADEFLRWVYDNGIRVAGLVNRRERERAIFLA